MLGRETDENSIWHIIKFKWQKISSVSCEPFQVEYFSS